MKHIRNRQQGFALIAALSVLSIILILVMMSATVSLRSRTTNAFESRKTQAFYVAQSGLERAIFKAVRLNNKDLPATVTNNEQAAIWVANQLNGTTGTLPSGTFTVSTSVVAGATATDPAKITVVSEGTTLSSTSVRRVSSAFPVKINLTPPPETSPMIASAPAALTITGNSGINGSAPIAGDNASAGATHTMTCPAAFQSALTCQKSSTDPDKYKLTYSGAVPSTFIAGKILRPTSVLSGQTSEERYIVEKIENGVVELSVLSDYIVGVGGVAIRRTFASTGNIQMREINSTPALLMPPGTDFSKTSANVRDVCGTYECGHYTMSSDSLFKSMLGGTKDEMQARFQAINSIVPGTYNTSGTAGCNRAVQWLRLSSATANLQECDPPQMVVIDARGTSGTSLDINIPSQQSFRGFLYVIANNGVQVKMTGNVGFAGAVIMDNGTGGIDMTGNGNFNEDCAAVQSDDGLKKTPKLCYDRNILANIRDKYIDTILTTRVSDVKVRAAEWKEVGQP